LYGNIKTLKHNHIRPDTLIIISSLYDAMNKAVLTELKRAIKHNLEELSNQIIVSKGAYLSRRDIEHLITFMNRVKRYPYDVVYYIYNVSPYRDEFNPGAWHIYSLRFACRFGYIETVRLLLADSRVDLNPGVYNDAITYACETGHTNIVRLLLADDRVGSPDDRAIRNASYAGQSEVVRLLLEDGRSNPSSLENYSIRYASFYGHIEIVRMLMNDVRVDPSAMGNIALVYASSSGQTDIVKLLLTDARVVKAGLGKAIIEARNNCNDDVVDLLMEIIMRAV